MKEVLSKNVVLNLLMSLIFAVLSIFLISNPDVTLKTLTIILGIVILAIGVVKFIIYLKRKNEDSLALDINLFESVVFIILGISTISFNSFVATIFRIAISIWIIYSSIGRINLSIYLKKINIDKWYIVLISSLLMFICGLFVMFNSGAIVVTIGIIFLIYCIIDIIESIIILNFLSKI